MHRQRSVSRSAAFPRVVPVRSILWGVAFTAEIPPAMPSRGRINDDGCILCLDWARSSRTWRRHSESHYANASTRPRLCDSQRGRVHVGGRSPEEVGLVALRQFAADVTRSINPDSWAILLRSSRLLSDGCHEFGVVGGRSSEADFHCLDEKVGGPSSECHSAQPRDVAPRSAIPPFVGSCESCGCDDPAGARSHLRGIVGFRNRRRHGRRAHASR